MKTMKLAVACLLMSLPLIAAAQVGVSISLGQPGFYGRVDLGNYPPPQLVYGEPVIFQRSAVVQGPVYLRVPPGHAKNWGKHCGRYNACSRPVYFVDDSWYETTYVPAYRERHQHHDGDDNHDGHDKHGKGKGKGKKKDKD